MISCSLGFARTGGAQASINASRPRIGVQRARWDATEQADRGGSPAEVDRAQRPSPEQGRQRARGRIRAGGEGWGTSAAASRTSLRSTTAC
jgi:hypothetical protein